MTVFGFVLLLLGFGCCLAEVVEDFHRCRKFFASPNGEWFTPTTFNGIRYKRICQTLNGVAEYATYYDTEKRIPVYSAYQFTGFKSCTRSNNWFIEPQLDDPTKGGDVNYESVVPKALQGKYQALNKHYEGSGFHKGHLAPVYHASSQTCADATFTLTNVAPQDPSFNRGQWRKTEKDMADVLSKNCINKGLSAYVVTGVVAGVQNISDAVWVPSHFWTGFCCLDNNNVPKLSGGFYGKNENVKVQSVTVQQLEVNLSRAYDSGSFQVFGGSCHGDYRNLYSLSSHGRLNGPLVFFVIAPCLIVKLINE